MPKRLFQSFFHSENASSTLLLFAAFVAVFLANSEWAGFYHEVMEVKFGPEHGLVHLNLSVHHWINDGLMMLFFLVVGLEIKREFLRGELASIKRASFPIICALGGVIMPALLFMMINRAETANWSGWAIPTATDIAFALGLLSLGGKAVPMSLKVFLTALAIIDDLIAILVIALFYGEPLRIDPFFCAIGLIFGLVTLNLMRIKSLWPYLILGALLWYAVLRSGLHATLAGVLLAMTIPVGTNDADSPLRRLEDALHPYTAFLVMPVFALANAGLSFEGLHIEDLATPLTFGIMMGLFFGKQIGICLAAKMAMHMKWAVMPRDISPLQFYAVSCLAGVGFTMSLFIGTLAFKDPMIGNHVRLGVIGGSLLSALTGLLLLQLARKKSS